MRMMKKLLFGITVFFLFCTVARPDTIETSTSRASFGGNDFIDWAQLGSGTILSLGTLLNVTSTVTSRVFFLLNRQYSPA
jgi:hypothetical protein